MATFNRNGLLGLLWAISLSLLAGSVSSFPSLFSRSLLFQRGSQTHNHLPQQQHQQPQQQAQQESLALAANSIVPNFGALGLDQNDLLRLSAQPNDAELIGGQHQHHHLRRQQNQQHNFAASPSHFSHAYYKPPQMAATNHHHFNNQHNQQQQGFNAPNFGSVRPVANLEEPVVGRQVAFDEAPASPVASQVPVYGNQQQQQGLAPSQSEVVDKIEQHIGDQIEQGLNTAAQNDQQRPSASSYQARGNGSGEKETAASGENEATEAESEGEPAGDKRNHEQHEQKEPSEHHHQHHQHHGHDKHNSFEVHHKKGGKSYQYFHQGHHHYRR